jgi:GNAT superfamily N-acetyltransferase
MERDLAIKPLTPGRMADLASLFEQGGDPKWCWCAWFRLRGMSWSNASPGSNRAILESAARRGRRVGRAPGLVAYRDGEAVGWVALAPREEYERLEHSTVLARVDARPVWSIVCFVVSRHARRRGVSRALLNAAVEFARKQGAKMLEAYPVADDRGRVPAASAFHGVQSAFAKAGFKVVDVRRHNDAAPQRPIMRLELS